MAIQGLLCLLYTGIDLLHKIENLLHNLLTNSFCFLFFSLKNINYLFQLVTVTQPFASKSNRKENVGSIKHCYYQN